MNFPVTIYEVIRVVEGVPLFLDEHLDRLFHSARFTGVDTIPGPVALSLDIQNFLQREGRLEGNIKLGILLNDDMNQPTVELAYIPHAYPSASDYRDGVKIVSLYAERPLPNAKVQHNQLREEANRLMAEKGVYEVMLVDRNDKVTEGSKSNLFFIRDNMVFTSPPEKVLEGITRNRVIALCRKAGIPVVEEEIPFGRLDGYTAAFITGTSPKVLPICMADEVAYVTDLPLLRNIMKHYDEAIENYVAHHRNENGLVS